MAEYVIDLTGVEVKTIKEPHSIEAIEALWGLPVREEVVRCRDCKRYSEHEWILVTDVSDVCHFFGDGVKVEPDGFCAWGERRADG